LPQPGCSDGESWVIFFKNFSEHSPDYVSLHPGYMKNATFTKARSRWMERRRNLGVISGARLQRCSAFRIAAQSLGAVYGMST
jgi:hypothetical protein